LAPAAGEAALPPGCAAPRHPRAGGWEPPALRARLHWAGNGARETARALLCGSDGNGSAKPSELGASFAGAGR